MEYLRTYGLEMYIWQRHSLSRNIVPDYTVFSLALFGKETPVCALLERPTDGILGHMELAWMEKVF